VPQEYLDSLPEGRWADQMDDPERNTLLCVEGARIVGVVCFCRSRLEAFADWGEISAIYLLPEYMGKGFGRAMMEAALADASA
jgi:GNAT superfamily N-acetyltransferase